MGILASDLRLYVIRPTLKRIKLWTESAENLLLGTAAHESQLGHHLIQAKGPALGIYQIEPETHNDVWQNTLQYRSELSNLILEFLPNPCSQKEMEWNLITNLAYATTIARVIYLRAPEQLPEANNIEALANYWKTYYNTAFGKGNADDFIRDYSKFD